ncbi:MAG: enoyl-CoA hydratase/isomerase family protein [Actinomycetota bacterium]
MDHIRIENERDGAVRVITIDRPDKRNALSGEMFQQLIEAFRVEPPREERVTLLRSEGHVFCSGIDLNERLVYGAPPLDELCIAIEEYSLPVVARMQGDAIAGGAFLALFCDFVVAAKEARFWVSLVQIGLAPPWPLTRKLVELAPLALAKRLVLLGDPMPASALAEADAIAAAVAPEELDAEVERVVERLATNAPLSLRAIKATLSAKGYVEAPHEHVLELIAAARDSEDGREGVQARLERRMPQYAGR